MLAAAGSARGGLPRGDNTVVPGHPVRTTKGYVCRICRPSALFPSREALWTDHLFEPLLAWINGTLALSPWLELTGNAGDGP